MRSNTATLARWLKRQDLTMEELVETAEGLVDALVPKQTRYKVTERPDARTIRYYVTQGLLPKPVGYDGGRARYSGSHLLRLVWIKKLQAEHHTLARIAKVLEGATDQSALRALEAAPAAAAAAAAPPPARSAMPRAEGITLTPEILADPDKREELAESLEALAAWLRNMDEGRRK
jgi:DNA-binding transcriptional MerR regulator